MLDIDGQAIDEVEGEAGQGRWRAAKFEDQAGSPTLCTDQAA